MASPPIPPLPDYLSLLLTGALVPSLPLHICLSHLAKLPELPTRRRKVLMLTTSNHDTLKSDLEEYNDAWLNEESLKGRWAGLLDAIEIFYPSTPSHLLSLLALLQPATHGNSTLAKASVLQPPSKAILDVLPSLVILHELSSWFLDDNRSEEQTLSDYLRIVTLGLDFVRFLSSTQSSLFPVKLVLLDSRLAGLQLPVVRPVAKRRTGVGPNERNASNDGDDRGRKVEKLFPLIARYFEWVGEIRDVEVSPSSSPLGASSFTGTPTHQLTLKRSGWMSGQPDNDILRWDWREEREEADDFSGLSAARIIPLWGEEAGELVTDVMD